MAHIVASIVCKRTAIISAAVHYKRRGRQMPCSFAARMTLTGHVFRHLLHLPTPNKELLYLIRNKVDY